jgi:hypothetical protein
VYASSLRGGMNQTVLLCLTHLSSCHGPHLSSSLPYPNGCAAQPCLAGQPINSLEQAAGCVATMPDLPVDPTPAPAPSGGRKLSMTSPVRSLLQSGGNCNTIGQDGGGICPASHSGLGSASISYPRVGLGQSSSNCPPLDVNFVLAGELGGLLRGEGLHCLQSASIALQSRQK